MSVELLVTPVLAAALGYLAWRDLADHRLPDAVTLPLLTAGLALAALTPGLELRAAVLGAGGGFAVFWAIGAWFFARHAREGLGLGDAKLFAGAGAWLGWQALPSLLLIASLGGLAAALFRREGRGAELAFGPWLCLGFALLWGARLAG